jgi:hypothetical protein
MPLNRGDASQQGPPNWEQTAPYCRAWSPARPSTSRRNTHCVSEDRSRPADLPIGQGAKRRSTPMEKVAHSAPTPFSWRCTPHSSRYGLQRSGFQAGPFQKSSSDEMSFSSGWQPTSSPACSPRTPSPALCAPPSRASNERVVTRISPRRSAGGSAARNR